MSFFFAGDHQQIVPTQASFFFFCKTGKNLQSQLKCRQKKKILKVMSKIRRTRKLKTKFADRQSNRAHFISSQIELMRLRFPNKGLPMTHNRGAGLDHPLSLLIHLMTYLEKHNICSRVPESENGEDVCRSGPSYTNQDGDGSYPVADVPNFKCALYKVVFNSSLDGVEVRYHTSSKRTGFH